jgi:hypothetical protein
MSSPVACPIGSYVTDVTMVAGCDINGTLPNGVSQATKAASHADATILVRPRLETCLYEMYGSTISLASPSQVEDHQTPV